MNRFLSCLLVVLFCAAIPFNMYAQKTEKDEKEKKEDKLESQAAVAAAVNELRVAMIAGDSNQLKQLVAKQLSYGHSSGLIENREEFISKLSSGKSDFLSMELSNQSIIVDGNTAIVRHVLDGNINDNGQAGKVHLAVMLVWKEKKGKWVLLARQATKIP